MLMEVANSQRGFVEAVIERWFQPIYLYDDTDAHNRERLGHLLDNLITWIQTVAKKQDQTPAEAIAKMLKPSARTAAMHPDEARARELVSAAALGDPVLEQLLAEAASEPPFRGVSAHLMLYVSSLAGACLLHGDHPQTVFRPLLLLVHDAWTAFSNSQGKARADLVQEYVDGNIFAQWVRR
jgi:hypothetical protein